MKPEKTAKERQQELLEKQLAKAQQLRDTGKHSAYNHALKVAAVDTNVGKYLEAFNKAQKKAARRQVKPANVVTLKSTITNKR